MTLFYYRKCQLKNFKQINAILLFKNLPLWEGKRNLELDAKQGRDGIFLDFLYLSKDIIISDIHR